MTLVKKQIKLLSTIILGIVLFYMYFCSTGELVNSNLKYTKSEENKIRKIEDILEKANSSRYFNGNVLVAINGKVIVDTCYGMANFEEKDTLTKNSIFQLASLTKQFTAMGIMILKEDGKLDYDDKVKKYIPDFPYSKVTIRHLLNHTSGLPNYIYQVDRFWNKSDAPYNDDAIKILNRERLGLKFYAGRRFDYSNTNYMLLASIIEKISNKRYSKFLKKNIFKPLDMENTFVYSTAFRENQDRKMIPGYRHYSRGYNKFPITKFDGIVGDKGIYSTTGDLYKWDQALYSDKIVSKETLDEAFQNGKKNNGSKVGYGFGFRIRKDNYGNRLIYHNGLWGGFKNSISRNIKKKNTIILLEHTNCTYKHSVLRKIERIVNSNY